MHASCGAYTPRASRHAAPRRRQRTSHHRQDLHDVGSRRGPSHAPRSAWGLLSAFRRRLAALTRPRGQPAPSWARGPNLRARIRPKRRPRGKAEEHARTLGKVLPSPSLMLTTLTPCRGVPRRRGVRVSASAGCRVPLRGGSAKERPREGGCLAAPYTSPHTSPRRAARWMHAQGLGVGQGGARIPSEARTMAAESGGWRQARAQE